MNYTLRLQYVRIFTVQKNLLFHIRKYKLTWNFLSIIKKLSFMHNIMLLISF